MRPEVRDMDYEQYFANSLSGLKDEGRYRVFADLGRRAGKFPQATRYTKNGEAQNCDGVVLQRLSRHGSA